jgi:hypothetical protein
VIVSAWPYYYYYDPFFFTPFWYPYPIYPGYAWYGAYGDPSSAVRVDVKPREAKVFVDGYYSGLVDDFDGAFQRLRVRPGQHHIQIYLEGYHSITQAVYLSPASTYKIRGELTKLGPGEPAEPAPVPKAPPAPSATTRRGMPPPPDEGTPEAGPEPEQAPEPSPPQTERRHAPRESRFGKLSVRVQPVDAEVLIDGERWLGSDGQDVLVVNLSVGRHHVEISKRGYDRFVTDVEVSRGETESLNVSLSPAGRP